MLFTMSEIAATWRGEWDRGSTQRRDDPSGKGSGRFPKVWGHVPLSLMAYLGLHGKGDFRRYMGFIRMLGLTFTYVNSEVLPHFSNNCQIKARLGERGCNLVILF